MRLGLVTFTHFIEVDCGLTEDLSKVAEALDGLLPFRSTPRVSSEAVNFVVTVMTKDECLRSTDLFDRDDTTSPVLEATTSPADFREECT